MKQKLKRYKFVRDGMKPPCSCCMAISNSFDKRIRQYWYKVLEAEIREQRLRELVDKWIVEQSEYPPEGALAAAAVRVCVRELRAILNEGEKP